MSHRLVSAALFTILAGLPAFSGSAMAQAHQASGAPTSDDSVPPVRVQVAPPAISFSTALLGVQSPLGAQPTPGKPISAEIVTEHRQNFVDGNHISRSTHSTIYRDGQGRLRRESQLSVPGLPPGAVLSTFVTIVDQHSGYGYVLDTQEMVAHRYLLNGPAPSYLARLTAQNTGGTLLPLETLGATPTSPSSSTEASNSAANNSHWRLHSFPSHRHEANPGTSLNSGFLSSEAAAHTPALHIEQPFLAAPNPVRTLNLGEQTILGFRVKGTRVITTLPAGQIGNDRPIDIISEQWFSPELELVLRSLHRDPWAGEIVTNVTRISRGDPSAALFEIPAQYKVIDSATEGEHHVLEGSSK